MNDEIAEEATMRHRDEHENLRRAAPELTDELRSRVAPEWEG